MKICKYCKHWKRRENTCYGYCDITIKIGGKVILKGSIGLTNEYFHCARFEPRENSKHEQRAIRNSFKRI